MSRRSEADLGSLELLLDTICNTFGGVIFIAILVVVLLQMTGKSQPDEVDEQSQAELKASETLLADAEAELKILEAAAQRQQTLTADVTNPELLEQARQMQEAETERDRLSHRRSELLQSIAAKQIVVNDSSRQKSETEQALQAARSRTAVLQQALAKEVSVRSQTAKLPKLRETTKIEMALILRGGKLYVVQKRTPGGFAINNADVELQNGGNLLVTRPGAGLRVEDSSKSAIEQLLNQFDKSAHFVAVFTWPDSFEQFSILRTAMVNLGFEYRLVPLPQSEPGVKIVTGSSGPAQVQ